ncbi:MAG TPA: DUF998 domain-containing protein [Verrucomicrobiae bacterium]|nr:DUF998 domain-containing protein [Verrucomicrobiae bacterium]
MKQYLTRRPWLSITPVTVLAGLLYASWPLGYWLNPVANRGLASDLEAAHQPYNWVFISFDIVSGLLICIASWWLLRRLRNAESRLLTYAMLGFGVFGLLTAIDALLPLDCVSANVGQCRSVWHDPYFIVHGVASIGSIAGLTLSIMCVWWLAMRDYHSAKHLSWVMHGAMAVWFGFGTVTFWLIMLSRSSTLAQHVFIVLCSVWVVSLPYLIWRYAFAVPPHPVKQVIKKSRDL